MTGNDVDPAHTNDSGDDQEYRRLGEAMGRVADGAGLQQQDLASAADVEPATVAWWIAGEAVPSLGELFGLDRACGHPPGHILAAAGLLDPVFTNRETNPHRFPFDHSYPGFDGQVKRGLLGTAIRRTWLAAGYTQKQVAQRTGLLANAISRWATGKAAPDPLQVLALDRACNKPPGHIFVDVYDISAEPEQDQPAAPRRRKRPAQPARSTTRHTGDTEAGREEFGFVVGAVTRPAKPDTHTIVAYRDKHKDEVHINHPGREVRWLNAVLLPDHTAAEIRAVLRMAALSKPRPGISIGVITDQEWTDWHLWLWAPRPPTSPTAAELLDSEPEVRYPPGDDNSPEGALRKYLTTADARGTPPSLEDLAERFELPLETVERVADDVVRQWGWAWELGS